METLFLLVVAVSAVAGLALRSVVSRAVGRVLLVLGLAALVVPFGILGLLSAGWKPFPSSWNVGLLVLGSLAVAALVLPFALAVCVGRA